MGPNRWEFFRQASLAAKEPVSSFVQSEQHYVVGDSVFTATKMSPIHSDPRRLRVKSNQNMTTTAHRLYDTNRLLAPGQRGTPESYEAYCKDNAYWNDMDEASMANGLADATVPASQVLPECSRDSTTGEVYSASPGHLVTVATILLDNASYLSVHLPWLQSDKMAARTVDGVPRHLHKEEVTSEMCEAALRQHVALANRGYARVD